MNILWLLKKKKKKRYAQSALLIEKNQQCRPNSLLTITLLRVSFMYTHVHTVQKHNVQIWLGEITDFKKVNLKIEFKGGQRAWMMFAE